MLLPALLGACDRGPKQPNWVIIAPDTLRADRVGNESVTPAMTALSHDGVTFSNAFSQGSWTLPALASLLTGRFPVGTPAASGRVPFLSDGHTVPEILGMYGYHTAAFWGYSIPSGEGAYSKGFQEVSRLSAGSPFEGTDLQGLSIVDWLSRKPQEPFFALVHDIDFHAQVNTIFEGAQYGIDTVYRSRLTRAYDAAVRTYDDEVDQIVKTLDDTGQRDRTILVVISNHGEDLAEHGSTALHGMLFDTCLRVPLVIDDPASDREGATERTIVQTVDLAPTILARSGVPLDATMVGQSLLSLLGQDGPDYVARDVFSMTGRRSVSVRTPEKKLVIWAGRFFDAAPQMRGWEANVPEHEELYDLVKDPNERTDVYAAQAAAVAPLLSRLYAWRSQQDAETTSTAPLSTEAVQMLQQKGYWGLVNQEGATQAP